MFHNKYIKERRLDMVDSVSAFKPLTVDKPFTTVNYVTKDGEHISATKNNGIVTLVGDKNGTRQMPVDEFMKEFVKTLPVINDAPKMDTVEISSKPTVNAPAATAPKSEVDEKPQEAKTAPAAEAPKLLQLLKLVKNLM